MNLVSLIPAAVSVVSNLIFAALVIRRNPRSATNQLFALLGISFALWATATYFSFTTQTTENATYWLRAIMVLAIPQSLLFMLLMQTFPRVSLPIKKTTLFAVAFIGLVGVAVASSSLVFPEVIPTESGLYQPVPGPGLILFVPIAVGSVLIGLYHLIRKNIITTGIEKIQMRYLLIGSSIMFSLIILLNFVAVTFFNRTEFAAYGPLYTLPFVGLTAYTIIRHRLMDIRVALFRGLSLSFLIGSLLLIYGLLVVFAVPFIRELTGIKVEIISAAAALVSIPFARYIQASLTRLTDNILFQNKVNYQEEIATIARKLSSTIDIEDVTLTVLQAMKEIIRADEVIIFLQDPESEAFAPRAAIGNRRPNFHLENNHALLKYLRETPEPLISDELNLEKELTSREERLETINAIQNALEWLDAVVAMPLYVNNELTGVIILGNKLSGEPYTQEDVQFLATFSPQAAVALENARLYQESLKFSRKLELEVARATQELARANEQLRDLDKAKSEFLSVASHQLYTPLTSIRGYLSMILEGDYDNNPEGLRKAIDIVYQSTIREVTLLKELLDISRIESGRLVLNLESVDLYEMAAVLVEELLPKAMARNQSLSMATKPPDLPRVVVDQERIRQVMVNFVGNAIKYTQEQGTIKVEVKGEGNHVLFSVTDNGRGLEASEITKLFTKFTRVGGKDRYLAEGSGLGLYVAKQMIDEHHGTVEVVSPGKGQGSTFTMKLPIEGTPQSLNAGEKETIEIKASESSTSEPAAANSHHEE